MENNNKKNKVLAILAIGFLLISYLWGATKNVYLTSSVEFEVGETDEMGAFVNIQLDELSLTNYQKGNSVLHLFLTDLCRRFRDPSLIRPQLEIEYSEDKNRIQAITFFYPNIFKGTFSKIGYNTQGMYLTFDGDEDFYANNQEDYLFIRKDNPEIFNALYTGMVDLVFNKLPYDVVLEQNNELKAVMPIHKGKKNDLYISKGLVFIPSGSYSGEVGPVKSVDSFFMSSIEITKIQWNNVRAWANFNGYVGIVKGSVFPNNLGSYSYLTYGVQQKMFT